MASEVYSVRLPEEAIDRVREEALESGRRPTALVREWVLERLAEESSHPMVREPSAIYGAAVAPLVTEHLEEIAEACRARGVARLSVFGSAARARFDPERSDVDLVVAFLPMPPPVRASCFLGLIDDLERVLCRSVDLVEEGAVRNPYVRRSISSTARVIYGSA